ncbi:unnamed protein product [Paramecium pentaurelia]|uniref:EF-hand domain-containing protein n=1 Tax=Paramecium pentaurelia TaxID=43138 RepID=A0A8S1VE83_9CILI|nr:unnamed protein product [Paramecium pentaurelia]
MQSRGLSTPGKQKQEVLQIVFDLGEKKKETLHVYDDSDITMIAKEFVNKHQLREEASILIEQTIISNLQDSHCSKQSIFDRLHNEAAVKTQKRQQQFITNSLSQTFSPQKTLAYNPGEQLYLKSKQSRVLEPKQDVLYSFKPYISEKSLSLAKRPNMSTQDYLIMQGKQMAQKKEQLRSSRMAEQNQQCSFQPTINPISQKITQEKERNYSSAQKTQIHDRLYQQGLNSIKKKKEASQMINQSYMMSPLKRKPSDIPFLERMQISIQKRQRKLEETVMTEEPTHDITTGQKLYRPIIGRPPNNDRNNSNLPIGDYLFQMRTVQEDHHNYLIEQQKQSHMNSLAKSSEKSNQIYEDKKRKVLEEIFTLLDSDGDGQISASSIEISGIQSEILQILAPLLCEMESIQAHLDLESFIEAANRLIQSLNVSDKNKLINGLKQKKILDLEQCTFQPTLCNHSMKIVKSCPKQQQNKLELVKQEQEQKVMQECTFKPQLYNPLKIYDFILNQ